MATNLSDTLSFYLNRISTISSRYASNGSDAIPPKGANRGRYRDTQADALIRQAGHTQSLAKQAELYKALQRRLQETLAVIPLWYEDQYAVTRPQVRGYRLYSDGRLDGLLSVELSET